MNRLFVAVSVPEAVKALLAAQQLNLKQTLPGDLVRWADVAATHLTLVFLGEVSAANLGVVRQGLDFACRRAGPLVLRTAPLGAFPSEHRPSVLWTGVAGETEALQTLHFALVGQLEGFYREERVFKPHLTLGRVKKFGFHTAVREALANAPDYPPVPWRVESVGLYSSTLTPAGAVHTLLHEANLNTA